MGGGEREREVRFGNEACVSDISSFRNGLPIVSTEDSGLRRVIRSSLSYRPSRPYWGDRYRMSVSDRLSSGVLAIILMQNKMSRLYQVVQNNLVIKIVSYSAFCNNRF